MSAHRRAVIAFHHQLGFAFRRLRLSHDWLVRELLPVAKLLQKTISIQLVQEFAARDGAKWPRWRPRAVDHGKKHCNLAKDMFGDVTGELLTTRKLMAHDTEETMAPELSCSETESWAESWAGAATRERKHPQDEITCSCTAQ